ncbi:MAG: Oxygen-independent coproporphyrinogen-III oxidase-like protein YqeR [Candidatus Anoxychlamydiales bacterium]|nr:Oxygen-independent coproporphyrinogen-III oxidase-like protein YqeR [Candidatus Anoxychlamydiales bacterium]NGX36042.1 Oxygen-independent coproporphyrinogen-III oxidase-like protein YqeR [Candidatus Anoxychlamydiales bacterium]
MPITGKNLLSLYFHIPFCKKKCPYCHFYSIYHTNRDENDYLEAIEHHLDINKNILKNSTIGSIYFGGGTPSLLDIKTIESILNKISYSSGIEITLEANPDDLKNGKEKIKDLKKIGINRISLGAQTFDDNLLKILGRDHSSKEAIKAIFNIHDNGIENISIDLMYDIMGQDLSSWMKTLSEVKKLPIRHISLYNLTFEEKTPFYKKREKLSKDLPSEKESITFLNRAVIEFEKLGLKRYEISAFAKKGFESFHNLGYWQGRDFLGFGPSAFSYFEKRRFQNISNFKKYCSSFKNNASFIGFEEKLKRSDSILELLAISLRVASGVDIFEFEKKNGKIPITTLDILKKSDFVDFDKNKIFLNKKGFLFYDSLASMII